MWKEKIKKFLIKINPTYRKVDAISFQLNQLAKQYEDLKDLLRQSYQHEIAPPPKKISLSKQENELNVLAENFTEANFNDWIEFGFCTTFVSNWESELSHIARSGMYNAEYAYAEALLISIKEHEIPGAIVEFGVSSGIWLKKLDEIIQKINLNRSIYGFDSFEGLPMPDYTVDDQCWTEGQYAANIDDVKKYLKCEEKPYIHLIKGWFSETFPTEIVQAIKKIAYARIDCDLYHPTVECLDYLKGRLVDKAILVFDDWPRRSDMGEAKAFLEWHKNSGYEFEFLALNDRHHLYCRVHKVKQ